MIRLVEVPEDNVPNTILQVYGGLRDWNLREIAAAFPDSPAPAMDALMFHVNTPAIRRFVFLDNIPIALAGCIRLDSAKGRLYFLGTPDVETHGVRIAALIRKFLPKAAKTYGIRHLESRALAGNPKSPRWFGALGGTLDRIEPDQFGNAYETYVWDFP